MQVALWTSTIACLVLPFIDFFQIIPGLPIISIVFGGAFVACLYFFYSLKHHRILVFMTGIVLIRLTMDFTLYPHRSIENPPQYNKEDASKIASIVKNEPVYMYKKLLTRNTVYYIERATQKVLRFNDNLKDPGYFLMTEDEIPGNIPHKVFFRFINKHGQEFFLVKFD